MKKKSIAARVGVLAAALTLATTSLTSGTLAKYTNTYNFSAEALVAQWNTELAVKQGDKWVYSWQSDPMNVLKLADTSTDTIYGVASGKIAPGMSGKLEFIVRNAKTDEDNPSAQTANEVDTEYEIRVKPSGNGPDNLVFSYDKDGDPATSGDTVTVDMNKTTDNDDYDPDLGGFKLASGVLFANQTGNKAERKVDLYWNWPYEAKGATPNANDAADTLTGKVGGTVTYTFTVVMKQLDPTVSHSSSTAP